MLGVWLLRPSDTLARDLVAHVQAEPDSWFATQQVSAQGIGDALHRGGVAIDLTSDKVTYAHSCWFRGHYVPHLVVQTAQGPATVLLLHHEQVPGPRTFRESGMNGIIVPADRGSVAVLTHGADVQLLAQQMQQDVRWLPEPQLTAAAHDAAAGDPSRACRRPARRARPPAGTHSSRHTEEAAA